MRIVTWNVNGLRAILGKGFIASMERVNPDIICLQETKMQQGQAEINLEGYAQYWNSAVKKGYSGTAIFTRIEPLHATYGIGIAEHDNEGRVITLEFESFYLVNVYTPNSQAELRRLEYRMRWENEFRQYLVGLDRDKPVILCGDLNVAHQEIDLKNPRTNRDNAGFTDQERTQMTELVNSGFTDVFRALNPDVTDAYTWWNYRSNARSRNIGWRIDYFLVSDRLMEHVTSTLIHADIMGSDHCPVQLDIDLSK